MQGITSIIHLALKVSDIERSLTYYRDGLEFPEMFRLNQNGRLWLMYLKVTDAHYLELFPEASGDHSPPVGSNGVDHFCLQVDDIDAVVKRIAARGIEIFTWVTTPNGPEMRTAPGTGAVVGADGNKQAWLRDPDGNRIELMQMMPGNMAELALAAMKTRAS